MLLKKIFVIIRLTSYLSLILQGSPMQISHLQNSLMSFSPMINRAFMLTSAFSLALFALPANAGTHGHGNGHNDHDHHEHKEHKHDEYAEHKDHDDHGHEQHHHDHHGHDMHEHANDHETKAHEHGVATMHLTMVEHDVLIEVISPAYNALGFESKPNNTQQKQLKQTFAKINQGKLVEVNKTALCHLETKRARNPFADSENNSSHNDVSFEYKFHCEHPEKIANVNAANLFKAWPHLNTLRVEWIYKDHQSAITLKPETPSIEFN